MPTSGERSLGGLVAAATGIVVGNPAAGVDFSSVLAGNSELVAVTATLTTAVAAANRSVALRITDAGAHIVVRGIQSSAVQAASLVFDYTWMVGAGGIIAGATQIVMPLPSGLILASGATVASLTANIQAADQWSNVVLFTTAI